MHRPDARPGRGAPENRTPDRFNMPTREAGGDWLDAREFFRQVVDNYPGSPLRADAKLGVGDSYLGERSAESLVLALLENTKLSKDEADQIREMIDRAESASRRGRKS